MFQRKLPNTWAQKPVFIQTIATPCTTLLDSRMRFVCNKTPPPPAWTSNLSFSSHALGVTPKAKFTADQHPQYIYSPRELSRWVRALYEAMNPLDAMTLEELVRLWANEALRLFHDRLVTQEEQDWCQQKVRSKLSLSRYFTTVRVWTAAL